MLTLSQNVAQLEAQVEKLTREKVSAVNQLEEIQNQLASREMDATKVQRKILWAQHTSAAPLCST